MRYIYLLLITFIFASCGNQKMRFVRTNTNKQKVVEIADIPTIKKKSETVINPETQAEVSQVENNTATTEDLEQNVSIENEESSADLSLNNTESFPETVEDSVTVSAQEVDDITQEALRAEKKGNWSLALGIMIYVFSLLTILAAFLLAFNNFSPAGALIIIALALGILGSLIGSIILGISSLRAPYNTPKGRDRAVAGLILSLAFAGLMLFTFLFGLF